MKDFINEEIYRKFIHTLTEDEMNRSKNHKEKFICNTEKKINRDVYGVVYSLISDDPKEELLYRENTLKLFKTSYEIFKENHENKIYAFPFVLSKEKKLIRIKFLCENISHVFGFCDEKIFIIGSKDADNKMKILTSNKDFTTEYKNGKPCKTDSKRRFELFIDNLDLILKNETNKYQSLEVSAFNYGKLYTKLSSYVTYANLHKELAYVASGKKDKEELKNNKGKDRYKYFLLKNCFNHELETYKSCCLELLEEKNYYLPFSLTRLDPLVDSSTNGTIIKRNPINNSEIVLKITLTAELPSIEKFNNSINEIDISPKKKADISFSVYENSIGTIMARSEALYNDACIFINDNYKNTFVMVNQYELIGIIKKVKTIENMYLTDPHNYRHEYSLAIRVLSAVDLGESIGIDDETIKLVDEIIQTGIKNLEDYEPPKIKKKVIGDKEN